MNQVGRGSGSHSVWVLAFLASLAMPWAVAGQGVSGTVHDAVTSSAVAGAVVMLLGHDRAVLARAVTSSAGAFRLVATDATILRVLRIGFAPYERAIGSGGTGPWSVRLTPLGRTLRPVDVRSPIACPSRNDQREALALWSSATDALLAMVIAGADSSGGTVTQLLYNRRLTLDGRRVERQSSRRVITGNASPIRADRDPVEFVRVGYVEKRGLVSTYYGPDPEVLLDSSFAATHCLSVRLDSRAHPGEVGVAFAPPHERRAIPDIAGVLWLTRSPLALRSMTFEYRGVDPVVIDIRAGGRLDFATMGNGVPVIHSWHIRSPRLRQVRTGSVINGRIVPRGGMAVVDELHETGGLVVGGRLEDGTPLAAPLATLGGVVLTARTEAPVPGATVSLDSTDQATVTDHSGRFTFEQLLPGPHTIRVRDSVAVMTGRASSEGEVIPDTLAMQHVTRIASMNLSVTMDAAKPVEVRLPWREPVGGCGMEAVERRFFVMGMVFQPDSAPVPHAAVRLTWADTTRGTTVETSVDATSDLSGAFFMCGIPAERPLATRVITGPGAAHFGVSRITRIDHDELGQRRNSNLRALRLTIAPPVRSRSP